MQISPYTINVRNENYTVEQIDLGSEMQYKISTDCNYIMTVYRDAGGNWSANKDVEVLDETLISDIGSSIENHDA